MREQLLLERNAIITGANQGLGLAIAKEYVCAGANIIICARDAGLLEKAKTELDALTRKNQIVLAEPADVSCPKDVNRLVSKAISAFTQVHILVNNAGIYGPKGQIEDVEWDEWMRALEINLYGSILMCRAILQHLKFHNYGKIIQLSGGGATNPLPRLSSYATTKAAVVRFAETLAEETREHGVDVNAIAPGILNTRMLDEILEAGAKKVGEDFFARMQKIKAQGGTSVETGARLAVFLASTASDGITGKLISAVWDHWENWPEHLEELRNSDVYTLRRITGRDRSFAWGDK